jgi:tRNA A58 N-methylase Trm61
MPTPNLFNWPWGCGSIGEDDWHFLFKTIKEFGVKTVLEFGTGLSTLMMMGEVDSIVSYDTLEYHLENMKQRIASNVTLRHWDGKGVKEDLDRFDFAFVDGPSGGENREHSMRIASEHSDVVCVHDAGRKYEEQWQAKHLKPTFQWVSGGGRVRLWMKR